MSNFSFAELNALLAAKQQEVEQIKSEFDEFKEKFSDLEQRLSQVLGNEKPKVNAPSKPLRAFITDILANGQPMTIAEIAKRVLDAGYKTTAESRHFPNMVQQACTKATEIKRVGNKNIRPARYRLS